MQVKNIIKKHLDPDVVIKKNAKGFQVYRFQYGGRTVDLSYFPVKEPGNDYEGNSDGEDLVITGKFKIIVVGVGFKFGKEGLFDDVPMVNINISGTPYYRKQHMTTKQLGKLNDDSFTRGCKTLKENEGGSNG